MKNDTCVNNNGIKLPEIPSDAIRFEENTLPLLMPRELPHRKLPRDVWEKWRKYNDIPDIATVYGGEGGKLYHNVVCGERDQLVEELNRFEGNAKNIDYLKGEIAEIMHADTFNINAAQKGSKIRAKVLHSTEYASPDIVVGDQKIQSKYYKNGKESAKAQAKSTEQAAHNPGTKKAANNAIESGQSAPADSVYDGQTRVIPKDQMDEAKEYLDKKIGKESVNRPEEVKRYQNTKENLTDHIEEGGVESTPLTEGDAKEIAKKAKNGEVTNKDINLTDADIIKMDYVIRNAGKVGMQAAAVSAALSLVCGLVEKYKQEEKTVAEFTAEDWEDLFGSTLFQAGAAGVSATTLSVVGSFCDSAVPGVSALLMATFGIAAMVPDYVNGKMSKEEFLVGAEMVCLDAALVLVGTAVGQSLIPMPGLGALIGAIAASIAGAIIKKIWGEQMEELLAAINEKIEKLLTSIKTFFIDIWMKIIDFFKNTAEHLSLLKDEDFNYNLRHMYKNAEPAAAKGNTVDDVRYRTEMDTAYEREIIYGSN